MYTKRDAAQAGRRKKEMGMAGVMSNYKIVKQTSETSGVVITPKYIALAVIDKIAGGLLGGMRAVERLANRISSAFVKGAKFVGLAAFGLYEWIVTDAATSGIKRRIARVRRTAERRSPELAQELATLEEDMRELEEYRKLENIFHKTLVAMNILWAMAYIATRLI